jgi:hypothetical protein
MKTALAGDLRLSKGAQMRLVLMLIPLLVALAVPATAVAVEPTRETVNATNRLTSTCPNGAVLVSEINLTQERTTFYDSDGRTVRQLWVVTLEGTTTNLSTGESVPNFGLRVFHRDLLTGEVFTTGVNTVVLLPDGGAAVIFPGRLVFDAQGRLIEHNGVDAERELAERCAALTA